MSRHALRILLGFVLINPWGAVAAAPVDACVTIAADAERLACYDGLFRDKKRQSPPPATTATPAPPSLGQEQLERRRVEPPKEVSELRSTVVGITRRARSELVVELANAQVWGQTSPRYLTIKEGDEVVIRRARMGGYILTTERGASTRVRRLR